MSCKNLTCIICPRGCALSIDIDENNNVLSVTGNTCKRGEKYAFDECTNPVRTVTSTMRCTDGSVVSVKTDKAIPKSKITECMNLINNTTIKNHVKIGDIAVENVFGSNIVITSNH